MKKTPFLDKPRTFANETGKRTDVCDSPLCALWGLKLKAEERGPGTSPREPNLLSQETLIHTHLISTHAETAGIIHAAARARVHFLVEAGTHTHYIAFDDGGGRLGMIRQTDPETPKKSCDFIQIIGRSELLASRRSS